MLRFFKPISPHDALQQHKHQLQQSAAASAAAAAASVTAAALRRGPGRPKKQLDASAVLLAAAALDGEEEPSTKRGKYCNWSVHRQCAAAKRAHALTRCLMCGRLASPYIHDILATYQLNLHNAKHTVAYLQRSYPQLPTESEPRFAGLAQADRHGRLGAAPDRRNEFLYRSVISGGHRAAVHLQDRDGLNRHTLPRLT